jgi:hypothetical protein
MRVGRLKAGLFAAAAIAAAMPASAQADVWEPVKGSLPAAGAVAAIDRALSAFQVGPQADDTAVLALGLPVSLA